MVRPGIVLDNKNKYKAEILITGIWKHRGCPRDCCTTIFYSTPLITLLISSLVTHQTSINITIIILLSSYLPNFSVYSSLSEKYLKYIFYKIKYLCYILNWMNKIKKILNNFLTSQIHVQLILSVVIG